MDVHGSIKLPTVDKIVKKYGLESGQRTQKFIDSEVLRLSQPYVPFKTGTLQRLAQLATIVGSGNVVYPRTIC